MRLPTRGKQDWRSFRRTTSRRLPGAAYRLIGNAYRATNSFMILQRTNTALAAAACKTAPVRVDCSALHRVPLFHVGGYS
jgi:drug/metabolite transporter (DMT)-like permease